MVFPSKVYIFATGTAIIINNPKINIIQELIKYNFDEWYESINFNDNNAGKTNEVNAPPIAPVKSNIKLNAWPKLYSSIVYNLLIIYCFTRGICTRDIVGITFKSECHYFSI